MLLVYLFHFSGLNNDSTPETFNLRFHMKQDVFPCQYIKIGESTPTSLFYVLITFLNPLMHTKVHVPHSVYRLSFPLACRLEKINLTSFVCLPPGHPTMHASVHCLYSLRLHCTCTIPSSQLPFSPGASASTSAYGTSS